MMAESLRDIEETTNTMLFIMQNSTSHIQRQISDVVKSMDSLKAEIHSMKGLIGVQGKRERLEWAIANSDINSFAFMDGDYDENSSLLVKHILMRFRRDEGFFLGDRYIRYPTQAGRRDFRDALRAQIHDLTGIQPAFENIGHGMMIVYRSNL